MAEYIVQATGITKNDIRQVVHIHRQEIMQGFLSSLGHRALEIIFSHAANSKSGVLLIAREREGISVCGFLLGTFNTSDFYKEFLLRKSIMAVITILPQILSLGRIRKAFEILLYPSKKALQNLPNAELLDVAVTRKYQGKGLAQILFQEFSKILEENNIKEFKITTGDSLLRAQSFYEKLGAEKVAIIEVHKGRKTIIYRHKIQ